MNLRLLNLFEVPEMKIKSNQQLKILDLSHNKIKELPNEFFNYIPNIVKICLDYNKLTQMEIGTKKLGKKQTSSEPLTKLQIL